VYNKPNGCSASGALGPGPDHKQQHYMNMPIKHGFEFRINVILGSTDTTFFEDI
jgi:hypothetical protein